MFLDLRLVFINITLRYYDDVTFFFNVNAMLKRLSPGQDIKRYPVQLYNQKVFFVHQVLGPNTLGAFLSFNEL